MHMKGLKFGVSLIEITIAVALMALAMVPIVAGLTNYFKRTLSISASLDYAERAYSLLNDLLYEVPYVETQRMLEDNGANVLNVTDLTQRDSVTITDLSQIKKRNGDLLCPLSTVPDGTDTPKGEWKVDSKGTYFEFKGVKYYFTLRITNIPLQFHWRQYTLSNTRDSVISTSIATYGPPGQPDIKTVDLDGNIRDMFQKLELFINWSDYGQDFTYSFVTFKANLDNSNES